MSEERSDRILRRILRVALVGICLGAAGFVVGIFARDWFIVALGAFATWLSVKAYFLLVKGH